MIYALNFFSKKKEKEQKKSGVNTRDPRRARWNFQGVLHDSLFLYLEFDMNKYLKNSGNYEVLRMKLDIYYHCYYYLFIGALWDPALCCDDFIREVWDFPVLTVSYLQ